MHFSFFLLLEISLLHYTAEKTKDRKKTRSKERRIENKTKGGAAREHNIALKIRALLQICRKHLFQINIIHMNPPRPY